ncbi:ABC transporter ATP-binding protein [Rubripirellula amarantea]|uniref:Putative ABC transporter ATP-binding protein YxlF n=1 Tax=Rubripirellula amarantea TaxID=2527999 RepID=A0A5C5WR64_9BACT|nr:ABC transporter ATP-binding protein [Rubripirellula amarantea]MDA8744702.1 ABC transporter ATP-binding protein [Rubripirellula amarantea]TWT52735.1 putative ABC transporter ATP-binding protein YxlF [Rubripirellula amarantea]
MRKTYGKWSLTNRRQQVEALCGVTLDAYAGEVFGLLGPNGAGKTTLIKTLLGVVKPTSGSASLFGSPVGSSASRKRVGYLPESLRVDRHHTARSALNFYGRLSQMDTASIHRRSDELLELVGLRGRDRESVRRFSKGMYQRLGLAQALMHDPDLLVLDEPTDGLDPVGRNEVRKVIERLRDLGKTIFLNSHILQEVELVCTRVAIMARGNILAIGPIETLRASNLVGSYITISVASPDRDLDASARDQALSRLRECFSGLDSASVEFSRLPNAEQMKIMPKTAGAIDQHRLDDLVDQLRGNGFSIVHLEFNQPSLEDTFMSLVGETDRS